MVRLEKVIYERAVNGINRAKAIGAPRKWYYANPYDHLRLQYDYFMNKTIFGRIMSPIAKWFNILEMKLHVDIFQQQGLTPEDRLLHLDKHLRRNVLFEHVARETFHPYHWILKARRRQRFCKIDYASPGFFVPEYIKNEAGTQTYLEYLRLTSQYANHIYDNYYSDMTPEARRSVVPKVNPFELVQNFGVLRNQAWDRYFMNENDTKWFTKEQTKVLKEQKTFLYNLTTAEGKKKFEDDINEINEKVPGAVASPGQKFNFKAYYSQIGV